MSPFSFTYWLYPNNGTAPYDNPKVIALLGVSALLIAAGIAMMYWRKRLANPMTKKLSVSWPSACIWFGIIALGLTISRAEGIQFLSMRVLWIIWLLGIGIFVLFQVLSFRRRHYTVMDKRRTVDERDRYLPRKKK